MIGLVCDMSQMPAVAVAVPSISYYISYTYIIMLHWYIKL